MSDAAQKLLAQIRALPEPEQEWIAGELWEEQEARDADIDELENDPEFQAMLAERLEQVEKHPEQLLDGDEVMAEARKRLRERRP
jgi:hypothetical protein